MTAALTVFRPVVIAPTFNNAATLSAVLAGLDELSLDVIVVDDGSTDGTAAILASRAGVLTHAVNRGKGAALRTGFDHAAGAGFTHAATIDTDGQLSPADVPALLSAAAADPSAVVLGVRDDSAADYPARSRIGRNVSNHLIWVESGVRVRDSQCGLRVYPLAGPTIGRCRADRYGFETEVITRSGWAGTPIAQVPVACRYFPGDRRVSHFRPWVDSARVLRLHGRLLAAAAVPASRRRRVLDPAGGPALSLMVRLFRWLNPVTAWRQVRREQAGRTRFAAGFGVGIFIGSVPVYGLQTILSLFAARRLRLHPVSVVAGSNVSTPPVGPVVMAASVAVGHLLLRGEWPRWVDYRRDRVGAIVGPLLADWAVGGVVVGAALGLLAFLCVDGLLRFLPEPRAAGVE